MDEHFYRKHLFDKAHTNPEFLNDLEKAAKAGNIAELPRSGVKLQEKILKSIEFHCSSLMDCKYS